jgi:hypothetical protein
MPTGMHKLPIKKPMSYNWQLDRHKFFARSKVGRFIQPVAPGKKHPAFASGIPFVNQLDV